MVQANEDSPEKRQADSFLSYLNEIEQLDISVKEAFKIRELLLSSLKNLSLPQAQLLVQWNNQCGIIESECQDVIMQGLPITNPALYSIQIMQNYLQLKQLEINELVGAIKQLFELVEAINLKKYKAVQNIMESSSDGENKSSITEDDVLSRDIVVWLDNQKKSGNIANIADVQASLDMCYDFINVKYSNIISKDRFLRVWEIASGEWICQNHQDLN